MTDPLRDSLHGLADVVEPVDLYDRAVRRSRHIARREATVGTVAALLAIGLLASGLWRMPDDDAHEAPPFALRSSPAHMIDPEPVPLPSVTHRAPTPTHHHSSAPAKPEKRRKNQPPAARTTPKPESRALADLPGHLFYQQTTPEPDIVRLSPSDGGIETVLPKAPSAVGISPDGRSIAYAVGGTLLIAQTAKTRGGQAPPHAGQAGDEQAEPVATGVSTAAQAPAWSPDGDRLLVNASTPAVLQVGSRTLTPLAAGLADGRHFRWSGDGTKLVYATTYCGLKVAAGGTDTTVPVIGDLRPMDNPDGLAACKPTSVDATGDHVTVQLQTTGQLGGGDGPEIGDAVVDTVTGDVLPLPVTGSVVGVIFAPDGNLLVRTRHDDETRLSLFTPSGKLLVQAVEPAAVRDLNLLAYTR
ncbi:TolB family protein [Actinoplanes sp. CA-030573]|uniref:TolB family protein n=1 Tax=Actinoplanes sp. CA-030573 TaxID=3239898 RepID=UPI003D95055C